MTDSYASLLSSLSLSLHRSILCSSESGSSSWLTALALSEHGFALHKGAFSPCGGFPSIRHPGDRARQFYTFDFLVFRRYGAISDHRV